MPKEELMVMLSPDLTEEEKSQYSMLFEKYPKLFAQYVLHEIKLHSNAMAVPQKLRRLGNIRREILEEEVSKLLVAGFIRRVDDADWLSPVVIVPKKNDKWRVCGFHTFKCGNQATSLANAFPR